MKIIIAGSREITNYKYVEDIVNSSKFVISEIVSGTARGVDKLGERYANKHDISLKRFPADWEKYGKSAGYRRNVDMANYADGLILIHNNTTGSLHMKNIAQKKEIKIEEHISIG